MKDVKFDHYDRYRKKFRKLVQLEREEEMERHESEIRNMSPGARQAAGRALLGMKGRDQGTGLGGNEIVKFVKGARLPDNEISVGDLVMVSKNQPLNDNNPTGTVIEKTNYSLTVAFRNRPIGFVYGRGLRLDLYVNDITFQRMLDALEQFEEVLPQRKYLREILLGRREPRFGKAMDSEPRNEQLNAAQWDAVQQSLYAKDIFLIHGPPGTGKTTTLIEVIEQHVDRGEKVLATADSNVAVDNIVDFLSQRGRRVVRVGHPARVTETLRHHTLDYLIEDDEDYQQAQELRERAYELDDEQENYAFPSGKNRRGLGNERIKKLASQGRSARGLSRDKIQSMARWIGLQEQISDLIGRAEKLEDQAANRLIATAEVVCTTNSTAGSELMQGREFDMVAIDEATQATEPSCLISMLRGSKVVMAGDHKQLPPTILNREAERGGLANTLFERLLELHGDRIKGMLTIQYRMNTDIMDFPNAHFYEGQLQADNAVANHTLDISVKGEGLVAEACRPKRVVVFFDTAGGAPERSRGRSTSKENEREAELTEETVTTLISSGVQPEVIGVISPYDDQVDLLSRKLDEPGLEIKTVDGFQGREKDVIVLSFVRSNERDQMGFLTDLRRLNVSITRARKKLIMIGDSETLSDHPTYSELVQYAAEKHGLLQAGPEHTAAAEDAK